MECYENRKIVSMVVSDSISYNHQVLKNPDAEKFVYHTHDRFEIIFLIRGNMQYVAEGRCYDLEAGDLILTRPSVFHTIFPKDDSTYERYDAIIDEKLIDRGIRDKIPKNQHVFKFARDERIYELFSKLDTYYGRFEESEYAHLAFNVIEELIYNLTLFDGAGEWGTVNPLIDKATSYILEHLDKIRGIDEISDALYVTKSHLHHIFIKYLRMTPAKYILSKRLLRAQKRILRGGKPTDVYTECGFEDYATFFRNYKKYFGYAPSQTHSTEIRRDIIQ